MKFFDLEILGLAGGNNRAVQHVSHYEGYCYLTKYTTGQYWIGCKTGWGKGSAYKTTYKEDVLEK